ncbi:hypothetical protein D3C78_1452110 [compost metagenome]
MGPPFVKKILSVALNFANAKDVFKSISGVCSCSKELNALTLFFLASFSASTLTCFSIDPFFTAWYSTEKETESPG